MSQLLESNDSGRTNDGIYTQSDGYCPSSQIHYQSHHLLLRRFDLHLLLLPRVIILFHCYDQKYIGKDKSYAEAIPNGNDYRGLRILEIADIEI